MKTEITKAILAKIAEGDEEAFRQVYDCYWDVVYHFIRKKGGSAALAEHCAQEIFSMVWYRRTEWTVRTIKDYIASASRDYALKIIKDTVAMTLQMGETPDDVADTSLNLWTREIICLAKAELQSRMEVRGSLNQH
jgi:RNA polymerase sigma-70 factor (ECF subfamily)